MKTGKSRLAFFIVLGFIVFSMGYCIVFWDRGLLDLKKLQVELSTIQTASNDLLEENIRLNREITLLKHNPRYIEKIAREELGLAKRDEIVYKKDKDRAGLLSPDVRQ